MFHRIPVIIIFIIPKKIRANILLSYYKFIVKDYFYIFTDNLISSFNKNLTL